MPEEKSMDDPIRFLVTMKRSDVEALDRAVRRQGIPRNRYILLAVMRAIRDEPQGCPICGKTETHSH